MDASPNRVMVVFFCHNANRYFVSTENPATANAINVPQNGVPIAFYGSLARAEWYVVDAAAGPDIIGVVEYFDFDDTPE